MTRTERKMLPILETAGLDISNGIRIQRLYPGYWQRSEGAWSFEIVDSDGRTICGSQWSCGELIAAHGNGCGPGVSAYFSDATHEWSLSPRTS